ncbi:MAG: GGDEF domain-containing protein [Lachnospiraceae bacterium]|nr:GGDEF domain-containing protein [Lachnospiraceae bacterium]
MLSKMRYYGFSKKSYLSVKSHCDETNIRHAEIAMTLFLAVMIVAYAMSIFNVIPYAQRNLYLMFAGFSAVPVILIFVFKRRIVRFNRILMYAVMLILLGLSIAFNKEEPFLISAVYPVYMFIGGVAFIDNMLNSVVFTFAETFVFCYTSHYFKPPSIARYDTIYAIIFMVLTLVFHYRFQRGLIKQFLNYERTLEIQQDLEVKSSFDALSGLLVRGRFFSLADTVMRSGEREDFVALCILDLDSFKQINDRFGHQIGDKAIQIAADTIWSELGSDLTKRWEFCERAMKEKESFAGRLGGDEFVIFFRTNGTWEDVEKQLRHLLDTLNAVELGELKGIHASFGVTEIKPDDIDIDAVYARADGALYEAKTLGKNRIIKG